MYCIVNEIRLKIINNKKENLMAKVLFSVSLSDTLFTIKNFDLTSFHHSSDRQGNKIDSSWYGELPRRYFADEAGKFHGKSELLDEELII
jgi:hypothetical protein